MPEAHYELLSLYLTAEQNSTGEIEFTAKTEAGLQRSPMWVATQLKKSTAAAARLNGTKSMSKFHPLACKEPYLEPHFAIF